MGVLRACARARTRLRLWNDGSLNREA